MSEGTSRPGLYVMVLLALLNSCDASDQAGKAAKELKRIADAVQQNAHAESDEK